MPKFPEFPPPFPPWADVKNVFEPAGFRSTPDEELNLHNQLFPYLEDEQKAFKDYSQLSKDAYNAGRPDIAYSLELMAEDEQRHALSIQAMLKDLKW